MPGELSNTLVLIVARIALPVLLILPIGSAVSGWVLLVRRFPDSSRGSQLLIHLWLLRRSNRRLPHEHCSERRALWGAPFDVAVLFRSFHPLRKPADQRPLLGLLDAWRWCHVIESGDSPRTVEALEHSPRLTGVGQSCRLAPCNGLSRPDCCWPSW